MEDTTGYNRTGDQEILRVREGVHKIASDMQVLLLGHTTTAASVTEITKDLLELKPDIKLIPALKWRVTLLERVIYGACAIILVAVITALVQGVVYVPLVQQMGPK